MRSGTSFFDLTIYRKTVNRFWPLWAANLVIWLFLLPLNGLIDMDRTLRFALNVGDWATDFGIIFALLFSLPVAMAVCSHMYNNRSANFMGALPCRREGQFLSTYAAGLTILMGPNLLIFLLTLLVELAGGYVVWSALLFWLGAMCAMEFFFFSFAVCLGQFGGHILALPVFYGVFNAIVVALYSLLQWVLNVYYFGYAGIGGIWEALSMWCTPVAMFYQMDIDMTSVGAEILTDIEGFWICGVYAIVAVVLTVCALLLYRRRHLETAGDIVAVKVMRPVFKYGVAICVGLFFGFLMEQMFGLTEVGMLIWMVVWGVIGYFVAQMLLDKSIRVFKKWKGAIAVTAVFLALFAVVSFDLTGYESKVPSADEVASVQFSGLAGGPYDDGRSVSQMVLTDPAEIEKVVTLHHAIVEAGPDGGEDVVNDHPYVTFNVAYTMEDGSRLVRRYSVPMGDKALSIAQSIRDLPEVRRHAYRLDELEGYLAAGGTLAHVDYYWDSVAGDAGAFNFSGEAAQRIWDAVMTDFENGLIGVHTVGDNSDYLANKLEFKFRKPANAPVYVVETEEVPDVPGVDVEPYEPADENGYTYTYRSFSVLSQSSATLEVLEELIEMDNRYQEDPSLEDVMAGKREG